MRPTVHHPPRSPGFQDGLPSKRLVCVTFLAGLVVGLLLSCLRSVAGEAANAADAMPRIGNVDFYGIRKVQVPVVRAALPLKEGDFLPESREEVERRVSKIRGVSHVYLNLVCCDDSGRSTLFVGVEETGARGIQFHRNPTGEARLPYEMSQAGDALDLALKEAVQRGDAGEDQSQGHSLAQDATARSIQELFIEFAFRDLKLLKRVLRLSADATHRARAAEIIAYAQDKRTVVKDLVRATHDPAPGVRNDAVRALALIAAHAQQRPELKLQVPWAPFIDLLHSPVWTDRNKASFALMELTVNRDRELLKQLKADALPELLEMAQWKSRGHAFPSFLILGRIRGLADETIFKAWDDGNQQSVIGHFRKPAP